MENPEVEHPLGQGLGNIEDEFMEDPSHNVEEDAIIEGAGLLPIEFGTDQQSSIIDQIQYV